MLTQQSKMSTTKVARALGCSVAVAAILSILPHTSRAAPVGGVVASGNASISNSGLVTTITQSTDRAVIDWSSFNLAANETARFVVPSDSSATLNRITGGVSTISGSVESTGVVYFSNPNGLVFDATSRVSANGFIATTGTISNFDFMNRGEFAGFGTSAVTLNGVIAAPAITALAGTVAAHGNLSAGSGKILLSSTYLTTIGAGAAISADSGANGTGGKIIVWSDTHTDFLGTITAVGGSTTGDGGFVEVSGKNTLNFAGTVSTLAPHGKTGTLLLDPSDITISAGGNTVTNSSTTFSSNSSSSIVNINSLKNALGSNNIIIDANAGTGSGSGIITVASDILAAATGSNSLTLNGAQIVINANITMRTGGNLILNANRASVWQDPTKVITASTVSGTSVDGFALGGANKINNLGTITNSGTAGILVKNNQALTINAGTIDGGKGGVMVVTPGYDLTLGGSVAMRGSSLRLDVGGSKNILGGRTLSWSGGELYYTGAATGNAATLALGSSNFVFVTDNRTTTADVSIVDSTAMPADFTTAGSGLTITTTGTTTGKGLVYGGAVSIDGVSTGAAQNLRYIEGADLAVTTDSSFSGSLTLVGSGMDSFGVRITAGLRTSHGGDLNLVQIGTTLGSAIFVGGLPTAAGALTVTQMGISGGKGISVSAELRLTAGGDLALTQVGSAVLEGISVFQSNLNASGDLSLVLSGSAGIGFDGIGLNSFGTSAEEVVAFAAGSDGQVTLKTFHQTLSMNGADNYSASGGRLRIDLGKGAMISDAGAYSFKANGLAVYYTGATTGNSAKIAVGSGTFTFVNDRRSVTSAVSLTSSTTNSDATNGWGAAPTYGTTGNDFTLGGLTITGTGGAAKLNGLGVVYGGTVTIDGVAAGAGGGTANGLNYIEAAKMIVSGTGSSFSGGLTLVGNGSGDLELKTNLKTAGDLSLVQSGTGGLTASGTSLWLNLGSGRLKSSGKTLTANGVDFQFSGATSGHSATIAVGSGSFAYVYDHRLTTTATTINNTSIFAASYGGTAGNRTIAGLTVTGSSDLALQGHSAIYGGAVTIDGISTGDAKNLTAIEGSSITVSGAGSVFAGSLSLRTGGTISLGANLTTVGDLKFSATNMILTSQVTTSGGNLTINLGTGTYTSGSFTLTATNLNLALTADAVTGTNNGIVFALGSGSLTLTGMAAATLSGGTTKYYDYDGSVSGTHKGTTELAADPNGLTISKWKFYGGTKGTAAGDTVWMNTKSLAAGKVVREIAPITVTKAGVDPTSTNGNYLFKSATSAANLYSDYDLTASREISFVSVGSSATPFSLTTVLPTATAIIFTGDNSFSGDLTLSTSGTITEIAGASNSLRITGNGKLIVTGSTAITLTNSGNAISSLGALNSTGAIAITTSAGLTLNGNISAGGAIGLTATGLILGAAITTSGGALSIDIRTTGVLATGTHILTTSSRNLTLTAGSVTGTSDRGTVFELGSGTITVTGNAAGIFSGGNLQFWNFDPDDATNHKGGTQLASDPNAADAKWGFSVDSAGAVGTVWMDFKTLAAGKVVKQTVRIGLTRVGLDIRRNTGTILFRNLATSDSFVDTDLAAGHEMTLVSVGGAADRKSIAANLASSTSKASKISFEGDSYFSGDLSLFATGDIIQTAGKLDLGSSALVLSGANITLSHGSNVIGTLGAITATGTVTVTTIGGLTLNGNIDAGGAIQLTATGMILGGAITTSGGALSIDIGTTGVLATGGHSLSTSNRNLSLTAGSVTGATNGTTVFALGSGTITVTGTAAAIVTAGATQFYDYDPSEDLHHQGSTRLAFDPSAAGVTWRFYGEAVTAADRPEMNGEVWMNGGSLTAGKVIKVISQTAVTRAGLNISNPTGNIQFKTLETIDAAYSEVLLDAGHRVKFVAMGTADSPFVLKTMPLPTEIHFIGANFFMGDLILKVKDTTVGLTDGYISQDASSSLTVTDGRLVITSSYGVSLNNSSNQIGSLGSISAAATVTIATGALLTLTGDMSGAQINLTGDGIKFVRSLTVSNGNLSLTSPNGAISQEVGALVSFGFQRRLIVNSSSSITLTNSGNGMGSLGLLKSSGAITIASASVLNLLGNIDAGGAVSMTSSQAMEIAQNQGISFKSGGAFRLTATGLRIGSPVTSSGGAVTINLGEGLYFSSTGIPIATSPSYGWTTTDQDMTINAGLIQFGTGILVDVGTAKFRSSFAPKNLFKGERIYISNGFSDAEKNRIRENDADAEFHTVTELNLGILASNFSVTTPAIVDPEGLYYTGEIRFDGATRSYPSPTATITFWNVRGSAVTVLADTKPFPDRPLFNGTLRFGGVQNDFSSFNFATTPETKAIVARNSILKGMITLGTNSLEFQPGAGLGSGSLGFTDGLAVKLIFDGEFVQEKLDGHFQMANNSLELNPNGNWLQLKNGANRFGTISISTGGANLRIASAGDLNFSSLSTAGGWVVLDTSGAIHAERVSAGSVSFRAGGSVFLSGVFAAASGSGSLVSLNNSAAGAVLGGIRSDSSLRVTGSGQVILIGDLIGNSTVSIDTAVAVGRDSSVTTNGGRVEFAKSVVALNPLVGLRLDAGYGGVIALGGAIGSPTLSLGWIDITGLLSNPGKFDIFSRLPIQRRSSGI